MNVPGSSGKRPRRELDYRSSHRARSHESAHAQDANPVARVLDHPLVPAEAAIVISEPDQLQDLMDHLRQSGRFGYDSEFIGELTYVPKLCLIQVASATQVALIDPLSGADLRPFWELLADESVEKIVHAGQQDLEPVVRELNRPAANIFDTQLAAGFIGLPYPLSLSKLVNELIGVKLGKGLTFTHWDQRPLTTMQLRYAADDVRYLVLLRQTLAERLETAGHAKWLEEECAAQCSPKLFGFNPEQYYLRVRGAGSLAPRNLAVLRELTIWRDAAARIANVPPRAFLKDEVMVELARNPIKSLDRMAKVKGLPKPVEREYGGQILELTARALSLPQDQLPAARDTEQSPMDKFRTDALWSAAQCLCSGQYLDPAVVTNRQEVNDFCNHLSNPGSSSTHRLLTGWRREAIGEPLARLLHRQTELNLSWQNGGLRALLVNGAPPRPRSV